MRGRILRWLAVPLTTALAVSVTLAHAGAHGTPRHSFVQASCDRGTCVPTVVASVEVGPEPWSAVSADSSIWVENDLGVARIDPTTNALQAAIPIGGIGDVAEGNGQVWVSSVLARPYVPSRMVAGRTNDRVRRAVLRPGPWRGVGVVEVRTGSAHMLVFHAPFERPSWRRSGNALLVTRLGS